MKPIILTLALILATAGETLAEAPDGLPESAADGECFAQVMLPGTAVRVTERILETEASVEVRSIPAQYETVQERVLIREGTTVYKSVPAVYETVAEQVEVAPGETRTVMKQALIEPARIIEEQIEPEYELIEVETLVAPAREEQIEIPATYKTIERIVPKDGVAEWVPVLCDANASPQKIAEIQTALTEAGHSIMIDGIFGPQTYAAMTAYQREHGLPVGVLTVSTVEQLGVSPS